MRTATTQRGSKEFEELAPYLKAVRDYPPLSRDEEHAFAVRARKGDVKAKQKLVRHNLTYLQDHPLTALYLVGGYLALFVVRSHGDRFVRFFRAAAVGSILLDALQPNYTEFRLELTFVPIAAAGLAVGLGSLLDTLLGTQLLRPKAWLRR